MTWINHGLGAMVGAMLSPFRLLPPIVGLSVVSLLAAIGMLLVFRATSNQPAIAEVKRRIHAGIFEIRLFNDDLRAMFVAQLDILRHNLTYVRLSLAPMLWMFVPLLLLIAQLQFYYGYDGFAPGQSAVVKVRLSKRPALRPEPPRRSPSKPHRVCGCRLRSYGSHQSGRPHGGSAPRDPAITT